MTFIVPYILRLTKECYTDKQHSKTRDMLTSFPIGTENVFIQKQREMTERKLPLLLGSKGVTDIFKLKMKVETGLLCIQ